ncbi:MAG: 2-amino-4-hydroxy-6-hydroxymethyldihydropteridine diphosphokinase [Planctomycetota bacterium]
MSNLTTAYIGLGSNLGEDREASIRTALRMLGDNADIDVTHVSELYETAALGGAEQPGYLNGVAQVRTTLGAEDLYRKMHGVETSLGRVKEERWSPRIIDLDLLLFGGEVVNLPHLTVPHPQMHMRSFVLKGLAELDAHVLHPVLKEPVSQLLQRLNNEDFTFDAEVPQLVSVAGIIGVGKTTLTKKLSTVLGCKRVVEAYAQNPFMPLVYSGVRELALDSQLYFLTSRLEQLNPGALADGQIVISDYVFDKELIYARSLLNARQLALYEKIHGHLKDRAAAPRLVIYLYDSAEKCLERIRHRNRPYEQLITAEFLNRLRRDYEHLFENWRVCPVVRMSMSRFDCMRDSDMEHLANQVRGYVGAPCKSQGQ